MAEPYSGNPPNKGPARTFDEGKVVRDRDPGEEGQFARKDGRQRKAKEDRLNPDDIKKRISRLKTYQERDALVALLRRQYGDDAVKQYEDGSGSITVDGQKISIPANDDFGMSDKEQEEWARRTPGQWHDNDADVGGGGSHTIAGGDTLSAIARKYLGSASRWPEIYKLNKAAIDAEAKKHGKEGGGHWIFPGMKLKLPPKSQKASIDPVLATATKDWTAEKRRQASSKGWALPDGSFPIKDKRDWAKARQAIGRAGNRAAAIRHLVKRAKALGIPKTEYEGLTAAFSPQEIIAALRAQVHGIEVTHGLTAADDLNWGLNPTRQFNEALHPRGRDGKFIEKFGFVKGIGRIWEVIGGKYEYNDVEFDRSQVVNISEDVNGNVQLQIAVDGPDGNRRIALAEPENLTQVAAPKATLELPEVPGDIDNAIEESDLGLLQEALDEEVVPPFQGVDLTSPTYEGIDPNSALGQFYAREPGQPDDYGRRNASLMAEEDLEDAIAQLSTRIEEGRAGMSAQADLDVLRQEIEARRGLPRFRPEEAIPEPPEQFTLAAWQDDWAKVRNTLEAGDFIFEVDGETFIKASTPPALVSLYQRLVQMGYANGWLGSAPESEFRPRRMVPGRRLDTIEDLPDKTNVDATEILLDGVRTPISLGHEVQLEGSDEFIPVGAIQVYSDGDMLRVDNQRTPQWVPASSVRAVRPYTYPPNVERQIQEAGLDSGLNSIQMQLARDLAGRIRQGSFPRDPTPERIEALAEAMGLPLSDVQRIVQRALSMSG